MRGEPGDAVRASDADREQVADVLNEAVAEGRLDFTEFEDRLSRLYRCRTYGELRALVEDLPGATSAVEMLARGSRLERSGHWVVPRRLVVDNLAGPTVLDFSEAQIRGAQVEIVLNVRYGPTTLILPAGATADTTDLDVRWAGMRSRVPTGPAPGAVHFHVTGRQIGGPLRIRYRHRLRRS